MQNNPLQVNKPMQVIAWMVGLSELGFGLLAKFIDDGSMSGQFLWALIFLPFFVSACFFIVLFFRPNNLYGPSDFDNQDHFLKLQGKLKDIEDNPFIRYSKLDEPSIRLFLSAYRDDDKTKDEKWSTLIGQFDENTIKKALEHLTEYDWLSYGSHHYEKTKNGEDAHRILKEFVYGRLG